MGSSMSAVADMIEEQEYNRELASAKFLLERMTPERMMAIIKSLENDLNVVAKYGVGSESFWSHLRNAQNTVKNMK